MRFSWIPAVLLLVAAAPPLPAAPHLLRDFNQGPAGFQAEVYLGGVTDGQGVRYFMANDPAHGREIWRTDGTAAGTFRMTDVCPGPCDANPAILLLFHDRIYFTADDGSSGRELWSSPLTPNRAEPLGDLCPGPCSSETANLEELDGVLYFTASSSDSVRLFKSDGTRAGTEPFFDICRNCLQRSVPVSRLGDKLLFNPPERYDLWESDGTAAGTFPVRGLFAGQGFNPFDQASVARSGDRLFLINARGLWMSDLTVAGTRLVRPLEEIIPGLNRLPYFQRTTFRDGKLFAWLDWGEFIRTDGTHDGTVLVRRFTSSYTLGILDLPAGVVVADDTDALYLANANGETGEPFFALDPASYDFIDSIASVGERLYFSIVRWGDGIHLTSELWVSDGTVDGTHRLEAAPDRLSSFQNFDHPSEPGELLYFVEGGGYTGPGLWRTEGTEASTWKIRDFADVPASGGPLAQVRQGGRLLFSAQTSPANAPLFSTDGTAAGTRRLSLAASWARDFERLGSQLLFNTIAPPAPPATYQPGRGIWRTDGTVDGTVPVSVLGQLTGPTAVPGQLIYADVRSRSYYGQPEIELFRSDGTPEGTRLVRNIDPYQEDTGYHHICYGASSHPSAGAAIRSHVVFAADDGVHGRELWITDGTPLGTRLLRDIDPRRSPDPPGGCSGGIEPRTDSGLSSDPQRFLAYRSGALFTADDGQSGRELWWTDGTAQGTRRVRDLTPGPRGSSPHDLVVFRGKVYFLAATGAAGDQLWQTDGTAAGTTRVSDLTLAGLPSWASRLTPVGNRLFFTAFNGQTGSELWVTAGDTASTHLVADLHPGPISSAPQALTDIRGVLVFAADDGEAGLEPWRSDGTAAGTRRLGDLNPGPAASAPGPFDLAGTVVVTGADDGLHGREPWTIPLAEILTP